MTWFGCAFFILNSQYYLIMMNFFSAGQKSYISFSYQANGMFLNVPCCVSCICMSKDRFVSVCLLVADLLLIKMILS